MKRIINTVFFLICLSALSVNLFAQHCPFDGGRMIVVHLTDANDQPITSISESLRLREIDNPNPDSCSYANSLLSKPLLSPFDVFKRYERQNTSEFIKHYCADCNYLGKGYYAIILNMAEATCMMKKDNDFNYRERKFEIEFAQNGIKKVAEVPKDRIYSLCTVAGKWSRIIPVNLKVKKQ